VKFCEKNDNFCGLSKKREKLSCEKLIFISEFRLFYTQHTTSQFFMKQLYRRVAREDILGNFVLQILTF
jgi:hypothetical protein